MGAMRKILSVSTLGLVRFRSVREQNAHTARRAVRESERAGAAERAEVRERARARSREQGLR